MIRVSTRSSVSAVSVLNRSAPRAGREAEVQGGAQEAAEAEDEAHVDAAGSITVGSRGVLLVAQEQEQQQQEERRQQERRQEEGSLEGATGKEDRVVEEQL